jgi:hypothetical protein
VKFESLKNEFENDLKKETLNPFFPFPFLLLAHPARFFFFSFPGPKRTRLPTSFSREHAQPAHVAQLAPPPTQPIPFPFAFCAGR